MSDSSIPEMVAPSVLTTIVFVGVVLGVVALVLAGVRYASSALGDEPAAARRAVVRAAFGLGAWLLITGLVSASGVLERPMLPPPLALFVLASAAVTIAAAFSSFGTRLVRGVPIAALVMAQGFRLPLELVLHQWKN